DNRMAALAEAPNRNSSFAELVREAVLDRILDERLQHHARDDQIEHRGVDLLVDPKLRSEANALDVEILIHRLELFAQRHEMLLAAEEPPQQPGQLHDQRPSGFR